MSKNLSLFGTPNTKAKEKNSLPSTPQNEEQSSQKQTNIINCFQGYPKYSLDYINSIFFKNGRIYNLLERTTQKRIIKCGCVKSFCEAKYCQCYRNGQACHDQCACKQCKNKKPRRVSQPLWQGCKCRKSGCTKKYCQCFQNNRKCGPQCQCINCSNGV